MTPTAGIQQQSSSITYAWYVGSVYLFNQMIGTGLLAMPKAFVEVGWVLGLIILCLSAFMSYCTATYILEAHAIHNAIMKNKQEPVTTLDVANPSNTVNRNLTFHLLRVNMESWPSYVKAITMLLIRYSELVMKRLISYLNIKVIDDGFQHDIGINTNRVELREFGDEGGHDLYEIREKAELGDLCKLFFNTTGKVCYYIAICLYLIGAEAVYFATIGKSLTSTICCDAGRSSCFGVNDTNPCNRFSSISIKTTYRITILTISAVCLPMAFFNLSKSRYIQIMTMVYRWFAILTMIALALMRIVKGQGAKRSPHPALFQHIPNFSGIMLFGFLIQYSISNVITPVRNKKMLKTSLILVYASALVVTSLVAMTAAYGFNEAEILDLYTSNFVNPVFFKYALELYPVLALCANIPIFAITLRENLKTLFLRDQNPQSKPMIYVILFPILAVLPSVAVSLYTYDVGYLVAFTGSYAGAIVEYVIPTFLVILARRKAKKVFGVYKNNQYQSPFCSRIWSVIVMVWYMASVSITVYIAAS